MALVFREENFFCFFPFLLARLKKEPKDNTPLKISERHYKIYDIIMFARRVYIIISFFSPPDPVSPTLSRTRARRFSLSVSDPVVPRRSKSEPNPSVRLRRGVNRRASGAEEEEKNRELENRLSKPLRFKYLLT